MENTRQRGDVDILRNHTDNISPTALKVVDVSKGDKKKAL